MMTVISYDVDTKDSSGARRLRRVAKICVNYGQRVQNSVFECCADAATLEKIKKQLLDAIDCEKDSLRFYKLGNRYQSKIEQYGKSSSYEVEGFIAL